MDPHHFLLTEAFFRRFLNFLLPSRRPMDNMAAGWDRPQEDEFALCMLGLPSPYLTIAFPNHPPAFGEYLDLSVSARARAEWKRRFFRFLQALTFNDARRLILKSPTHTCRIPTLLELFPDARFVHITRDPFVVFPSTVNLWKKLYTKHGLQNPTFAGLEEHVFATYSRVRGALDEARPILKPGRFIELRYEDLVRDPVGQMRSVYAELDLGDFERTRPHVERFAAMMKDYETNRYEVPEELRRRIAERWGVRKENSEFGIRNSE
jgi:hypothetical protein